MAALVAVMLMVSFSTGVTGQSFPEWESCQSDSSIMVTPLVLALLTRNLGGRSLLCVCVARRRILFKAARLAKVILWNAPG